MSSAGDVPNGTQNLVWNHRNGTVEVSSEIAKMLTHDVIKSLLDRFLKEDHGDGTVRYDDEPILKEDKIRKPTRKQRGVLSGAYVAITKDGRRKTVCIRSVPVKDYSDDEDYTTIRFFDEKSSEWKAESAGPREDQ